MTNIIIYILGILSVLLVSGSIGILVMWKVAKDRHNVNIFEGLDFKFWKKEIAEVPEEPEHEKAFKSWAKAQGELALVMGEMRIAEFKRDWEAKHGKIKKKGK